MYGYDQEYCKIHNL